MHVRYRAWPACWGLALAIVWSGCQKRSPATKRPAMRCVLPASMLKALGEAKNVLDFPLGKRAGWLRLMRGKCTGWSPYLLVAIKLAKPASPMELYALLDRENPLEGADFKRDAERLCPGYAKMAQRRKGEDWKQHSDRMWRSCPALGEVVNARERADNQRLAFCALEVYRRLKRGGTAPKLARALSRIMLIDAPVVSLAIDHGVKLPESNSTTDHHGDPDVMISLSKVYFQGKWVVDVKSGRCDPNSKRDGPDGFLVEPLYKRLKVKTIQIKVAHNLRGTKPFSGWLSIAADGRAGYRLLAEVLHTA